MQSARFDLHVHSTASDGTLPPREVVALAKQRDLGGIALTDHDTCDGIEEAAGMAQALGIRLIPGVEISCSAPDGSQIHMLGYFIDPKNERLNRLFTAMRAERLERAGAIVARITEETGLLSLDDVLAESNGAPPGRPHIARAMAAAGIVDDADDAFRDGWLTPGGRVFVARDGVTISEAIEIVHGAGGIAVFAHPGARSKIGLRVASVRHAAEHGLDGVEVDHPGHEGEIVRQSAELADELGLIQTAGSDDHGSGIEGSRLGCRTVAARVIRQMEARVAEIRATASQA